MLALRGVAKGREVGHDAESRARAATPIANAWPMRDDTARRRKSLIQKTMHVTRTRRADGWVRGLRRNGKWRCACARHSADLSKQRGADVARCATGVDSGDVSSAGPKALPRRGEGRGPAAVNPHASRCRGSTYRSSRHAIRALRDRRLAPAAWARLFRATIAQSRRRPEAPARSPRKTPAAGRFVAEARAACPEPSEHRHDLRHR
jgi:hypothetical protein